MGLALPPFRFSLLLLNLLRREEQALSQVPTITELPAAMLFLLCGEENLSSLKLPVWHFVTVGDNITTPAHSSNATISGSSWI